MSSLYERAREGMTKLEGAISGLPVIRDYRNKELRREADARLRQAVADRLEAYRRKLTSLQRDMVTAGRLRALPEMERAVGRLQLLIDRIRTAAYGYAPFFDVQELREAELDRLIEFDETIAAVVPEINTRIDALNETVRKGGEGFEDALQQLMTTLTDLHDQFDRRDEVISFVTVPDEAPAADPHADEDL